MKEKNEETDPYPTRAVAGGLVFAIEESVDLAHEIYNPVFRKVPERLVER